MRVFVRYAFALKQAIPIPLGTDHKFGICLRACNINNNVVVAVSRCTTRRENTLFYLVWLFAFHCERLDVLGERVTRTESRTVLSRVELS